MKTIFYDIDTQRDFMHRDGALFVSALEDETEKPYGAEKILKNLKSLTEYAQKNNIQIIGSVDRHFHDDEELAKNGGPFPDHCMDKTPGQQKIAETYLDALFVENKQGAGTQSRIYTDDEIAKIKKSGKPILIEKQHYDVFTNPNTERILKDVERAIVYGVATDYCVRAAVNGMLQRGIEVYVVEDAIKGVNIDFNGNTDPDHCRKALEEMVANGARIITTEGVLRMSF